uniref:Uncharacterized protein n=1 Tax=Arundo donax TaxID=35708 RepID=A0A0A9BT58_ARUDO
MSSIYMCIPYVGPNSVFLELKNSPTKQQKHPSQQPSPAHYDLADPRPSSSLPLNRINRFD